MENAKNYTEEQLAFMRELKTLRKMKAIAKVETICLIILQAVFKIMVGVAISSLIIMLVIVDSIPLMEVFDRAAILCVISAVAAGVTYCIGSSVKAELIFLKWKINVQYRILGWNKEE